MLLRTGRVNIHARDKAQRTPIIWATVGGDAQLVRILLSHGANAGCVFRWRRGDLQDSARRRGGRQLP
jgi:ankyrin repeat protein